MYSFAKSFLVFCLLAIAFNSSAQQFGGNPPSLKWKQINTDTVRIIFPDGLRKLAAELAAISHQLGVTQSTLGNRVRKINIVLQNQTTQSNGYVGLGPYRSEFYMTPLQNSFELGSIPWHEQLVLHEYRHVQQFNNFRKGLSKVFYILAGELGLSFANSTAIPNWFWEGDAVYQETLTSSQGRGRLPFFYNGYRSLWADQRKYSWMKLRNGSLRDYVPNHYHLGYLLTAYGREKYGNDIWGKVTDDAVRFKGLFYPMQKAVKKYTGTDYKQFRQEALAFYKKETGESDPKSNKASSMQKHFAGDDEYPQWVDDSHLVLVSSNYKKIPRFVIRNIENGTEEKIRVKDISIDNYFSYRNQLIVYAAYDVDLRWGWRDYSEIRLLDIKTGKQRSVTQNTKYFAPDISADGKQIVAVQTLPDGSCALHLLDATSGSLTRAIPNRDSLFYTYPKFYSAQQVVTAIRNQKGEMGLGLVEMGTGSIEWLVPFSMNVIGFPNVQGDTICFTASDGEEDHVFALINKKLFQVRSAKASGNPGSYQLSTGHGKMVWVDFTSIGYRYTTENMNASSLEEVDIANLKKELPAFGISAIRNDSASLEKLTAVNYPVKNYSKGFRLLNFHSWLPTISDPEYSISLISENILNTLQTDIYFTYNNNEESKKIGFVTGYGAFYPWLRAGAGFTKDRLAGYVNNTRIRIDELEGRVGVLVPLNLMEGRTYSNLRIGTDYIYAKPQITGIYKDSFQISDYGYINSYLTLTNQSQKARQHIYSRFAQTLQLIYYHGVTNDHGWQFMANGNFYLPGVHVNHNFIVNLAWQKKDSARTGISYTNSFPFSRGYNATDFPNLFQEEQQFKAGANYHFPLVYPDWGFGSIVYFLRIRANAFYDFTRASGYNYNTKQKVSLDYRSYGGELFFDTKWWNQQPVSFGFRYSRLLDGDLQGLGPNQFEFILPVNLIAR